MVNRDNEYVRFNRKVTGWDTEQISIEDFRVSPQHDNIRAIGEQTSIWVTSITHSVTHDSDEYNRNRAFFHKSVNVGDGLNTSEEFFLANQWDIRSVEDVNTIIQKGVTEPELIAKTLTKEELETAVTDLMQYIDIASEVDVTADILKDIQQNIESWGSELTGWDNENRNKIRGHLEKIFTTHIKNALNVWKGEKSVDSQLIHTASKKLGTKLREKMERCVVASPEEREEIKVQETQEFKKLFTAFIDEHLT